MGYVDERQVVAMGNSGNAENKMRALAAMKEMRDHPDEAVAAMVDGGLRSVNDAVRFLTREGGGFGVDMGMWDQHQASDANEAVTMGPATGRQKYANERFPTLHSLGGVVGDVAPVGWAAKTGKYGVAGIGAAFDVNDSIWEGGERGSWIQKLGVFATPKDHRLDAKANTIEQKSSYQTV